MMSKLFKKLADGKISLFNWRDKIELNRGAKVDKPTPAMDYDTLYELSHRYFGILIRQDKYIRTVNGLIDSYDLEIQKWDIIQGLHESELDAMKKRCDERVSQSTYTKQLKEIRILSNKIREQENNILNLKRKVAKPVPTLSEDKIDKLIIHTEHVLAVMERNKKRVSTGHVDQIAISLGSLLKEMEKRYNNGEPQP